MSSTSASGGENQGDLGGQRPNVTMKILTRRRDESRNVLGAGLGQLDFFGVRGEKVRQNPVILSGYRATRGRNKGEAESVEVEKTTQWGSPLGREQVPLGFGARPIRGHDVKGV